MSSMYELQNIIEVVYSVGDIEKVKTFFCDYGGWDIAGSYDTDRSVLDFWNLEDKCTADELLLQFDHHPTGLLRIVKYHGVAQKYIRSSQKPWDTGGIMDINLRVPEVKKTFDELRDLGWHGLSDPLFQKMGPFELYDILMDGYDDIIVAFTHRTQPPLELKEGYKLPTHVYNSSLTVKSLSESRSYYRDKLGFSLLNEYEVKKDSPQENMFGIPFNIIPDVTCKANIFSLDGTRDVVFQAVEFDGVDGKDFSKEAIAPNRGLLLYRCRVKNLSAYYDFLLSNQVQITKPITELKIEPYGSVNCFSITSPDGVLWEFFEKK